MVDDRSPMAKALSKVSQVTSISLMFVIPALIGYGLDRWLNWTPILTVVGFLLGMIAAAWQLKNFIAQLNAEDESSS